MADDLGITGVNEQEVAAPDATGANEPEVAEPDVGQVETPDGSEPSSQWAEMRRQRQAAEARATEAEEKLARYEAEQTARSRALERVTGSEDGDVSVIADSLGVSTEDLLATIEAEQETERMKLENERLQNELNSVKAEKEMASDLQTIQKLDPNIKDLSDLGEQYMNYIKAGLSAEDAYYAVKAKEINTRSTPATPPGKVNNEPPTKDFITEAEWDAMTPEEQAVNWKLGRKSMTQW